jgi:hypothetical protein
VRVADHGVRLPGARGPVCEHCGVEALQHAVHQVADSLVVQLALRGGRVERKVERVPAVPSGGRFNSAQMVSRCAGRPGTAVKLLWPAVSRRFRPYTSQ